MCSLTAEEGGYPWLDSDEYTELRMAVEGIRRAEHECSDHDTSEGGRGAAGKQWQWYDEQQQRTLSKQEMLHRADTMLCEDGCPVRRSHGAAVKSFLELGERMGLQGVGS